MRRTLIPVGLYTFGALSGFYTAYRFMWRLMYRPGEK